MADHNRIRDFTWVLMRAGLRNPDWPPQVRSMLFACYANLCRSPFASALAERRLSERGIRGITCSSAGFVPFPGSTPPDAAVAAAAAYGVTVRGRQTRALTQTEIAAHDVVFVMEPEQLRSLRRRWPMHRGRYFLLPRFGATPPGMGAWERDRIPDPFGQRPEVFVRCFDRLSVSVGAVVDLLCAGAEAESDPCSRSGCRAPLIRT